MSHTYFLLTDYQQALDYGLKSLAMLQRLHPEDNPDVAASLESVRLIYFKLEDYQHALDYGLKALTMLQRLHLDDNLHIAASL